MDIPIILLALNGSLRNHIYAAVLLNFCLLFLLVFINHKSILKFLRQIDKKTWIILGIIFLGALLVRIFLPPHHHFMYIDEAWYMEAGKNMLETSTIGSYQKAIGWPFILRILFGIFGLTNWVALYASTMLGALSVFPMFLVSFALTKKKELSLAATLLFSLFPISILWSGSAETNVPSMFFLLLAVFFCLLYYEQKERGLLLLASAGVAFASLFRPEFYLLFILFLIGYFLNINKEKKIKEIVLDLSVFGLIALLTLPNLIHVMAYYASYNVIESDSFGTATGSNWSLLNLINNTLTYGYEMFVSAYQPVILLPFLLIGLAYMFLKHRKELLILLSAFLLLWLFYFTSWFQTIGGRERSYISFYWIISIFVVYGTYWLSKLLAGRLKNRISEKIIFLSIMVIIAICFIPGIMDKRIIFSPDSSRLLETQIPELAEKELPQECVILSNWPTVLASTTHLHVVEARNFLCRQSLRDDILTNNSCVLFFEDLFCATDRGADYKVICGEMKRGFDMETYKSYSQGEYTYTFYRLTGKSNESSMDQALLEHKIC
jgi:hypothetical protein